jgi:hypothetical protein
MLNHFQVIFFVLESIVEYYKFTKLIFKINCPLLKNLTHFTTPKKSKMEQEQEKNTTKSCQHHLLKQMIITNMK